MERGSTSFTWQVTPSMSLISARIFCASRSSTLISSEKVCSLTSTSTAMTSRLPSRLTSIW